MNQASTMTKEEAEDFQKRLDAFKAEIEPLMKKFKIALLTQALLTPDGRIGSQLVFYCSDKLKEQERVANLNRKGRRSEGIATPE